VGANDGKIMGRSISSKHAYTHYFKEKHMVEQVATKDQPTEQAANAMGFQIDAVDPEVQSGALVAPQAGGGTCGCGGAAGSSPSGTGIVSYVYTIGQLECRFGTLALQKEFAQATARTADTSGKTDQEAFCIVLSKHENRYLVRQLSWVLKIQGLDSYLLQPRDPADFDLLVEAICHATTHPNHIDVVIGLRGRIASPEMCNGLMVPIVSFDQMYYFDQDELISAIPKPKGVDAAKFEPAAEELFRRIMQGTDNLGATACNRAVNYAAMRYPAIYAKAADEFAQDSSLTGIECRTSPLDSTRSIIDVIFAYTNRKTDFTEKFFVRVDVTEEFPFLLTRLSPFFDQLI
jgi:hypothetical protein